MGIICPPSRDRVNVSKNLGKAAALPALPLLSPWSDSILFMKPSWIEGRRELVHTYIVDCIGVKDFVTYIFAHIKMTGLLQILYDCCN